MAHTYNLVRDNFLDVIFLKSDDGSLKNAIHQVVPMVQDYNKIINHLEHMPYNMKQHFIIDTGYAHLADLLSGSVQELIDLGQLLLHFHAEWEHVVMQVILDNAADYNITTIPELIHAYEVIEVVGLPVILHHELYEYAYENGITLNDLPPHATEQDVEETFVREVLEPAGFHRVHTNVVDAWYDTQPLSALRGLF